MLSGEIVNRIMSFFNFGSQELNTLSDARRRYVRHEGVHAEVTVGPYNYSIQDWSLGGIAFETAPDSRLTAGDRVTLTLTFRFLHGAISIQQPAQILRTSRRGTAAEFAPLSLTAKRQFDRVLDSLHTQNFLESQAA